jgi:3-phenylpropionate/cinnamic acid dioxygenase small subunit
MNIAHAATGTARVKALYGSLRDDVAFAAGAPMSDPVLSASAASALHTEARLLDARAFERWLALWDEDATYWVPLSPDGDPETDQALFLDDLRRLRERIWRMHDKSAWALYPQGDAVRLIGGVEAWPLDTPDEVLVLSAMTLQYVRLQSVFTTAGRQIHRLRRGTDGWRLVRKILLLPAQAAGTPHLGWLL